MAEAVQSGGRVHASVPHDSAARHVAGTAVYIDDMPEPAGLLHVHLGQSTRAHARLVKLDLSAVRAAPGVVLVLSADDVPGENDVSPVVHDDRLFAEGEVYCVGQSLFAVAATSMAAARAAASLAVVEYEDLPAAIDIATARALDLKIEASQRMARGDVAAALAESPRRLQGQFAIGGQDHFYLEGQVALATPREEGDVHVWSSTQHPTEVQHLIARVLGRPDHAVTVEVRRMGGAFGGKETQASLFAAAAALAAVKTGRPAKCRPDRDEDMVMTGKRHDFEVTYDVGFDDRGVLTGIALELASRCGATTDLSPAINDRAMFHVDNTYFLPAVEIVSHRFRTHTVSNTAFRGFGGPQGMIAIERVMDAVAQATGLDPLEVRRRNLYGEPGRDLTPYGQTVEDNVAPQILAELAASCDYEARKAQIDTFNAASPVLKKGIALTPVKFGISFTTKHLNQAGALIHVYADGSILLNHGGTEMGQGLYLKVAQVVAQAFQVDLARVRITSTVTDKVPNTSATAASSGADLNGMAALDAAERIKARLVSFAAEKWACRPEEVVFTPEGVRAGEVLIPFNDLCRQAYLARISLSSTGFYATPKIHYDRASHTGRPFYYFAYGAACSEVLIDTLTGEMKVTRADILHDVGQSLNPVIDLGQIEGGFIQGMGWLTTEELVFDDQGRLRTHAPSTYKIPTIGDRPAQLDVRLWAAGRNVEATVHRSKAVGEPPLMLAISVFSAITQAVASVAGHRVMPRLDAPATPEAILMACEDVRARGGAS
ncbi:MULTISPECIES: xanthine dehydrogenase molybdopterin binding subunit [unclassified Caulobacter]|uniref:xanthine dehydrogenase molybdopterin binding subunit n=1 Tax=unclassified Caulobacter TaxID=2648921 RepID=UPI000D3D5BAC|nr:MULTISPECIES: xanthine dehydrogenase molybdopterin binding subunit [unclassified Caulobacter]PTS91770.1 xanthine dehydrogenase molybdopterin binding subunit [Caulobacter sp. HMWF009]PTT10513.1 xanthine dehydrogenase molybdopterin binding subunit [Caulobacter sp. HMWF025]